MPENAEHVHISSAVVSVHPERQETVMRLLSAMDNVEIFHQGLSKIVIVLEGPDSAEIGGRLTEIGTLEGVLSANMVFERIVSLAELGE
jgi:nitrate reductase NapD